MVLLSHLASRDTSCQLLTSVTDMTIALLTVTDVTKIDGMVRWEPGTPDRLRRAALELFAANGYEQTTTADIAAAVGLTERTFYRHFADKRDVLFAGNASYLASFVEAIGDAPPDAATLDLVGAALHASAAGFDDAQRPRSRARQAIIDANPPLQERDRQKAADVAAAIAAALGARGIPEPAASLAAEIASAVRRIAFAAWIRDGETRPLDELDRDAMRELGVLVTGRMNT
jgi:AcrR family transcriptional regulator